MAESVTTWCINCVACNSQGTCPGCALPLPNVSWDRLQPLPRPLLTHLLLCCPEQDKSLEIMEEVFKPT